MPRLRRMRLCGIGHDSARFDDVTLDFTDRDGRPTNSVLWLRNGGGKTSLLSLFFAGVRPNKREFLGQRADDKVRRLADYVGPSDHGAVICEWELDSERCLFNDSPPRYLSGVFYQRKESDGSGDTEVDRLFFATLVSGSEPELTLDGLPLFADQGSGVRRRTLSGFRRQLRQLDHAHPDRNVFVEDKNQTKFEEELASRGIDPQVFFYQIRMNEREGGVTQLFSFASDEDFADFILEMTFDQRHARQVREQLSTFRQEIVERNEQLKPELEYCQGLISRLHKLSGIAQERMEVFRKTTLARGVLRGLSEWVTSHRTSLQTEVQRDQLRLAESKQTAEMERDAADLAQRLSAVHLREACRIHLKEVQADYEASERTRLKAKRQKDIGQAAVPLARVWDARREATRLRDLLQQKLKEFAPELQSLVKAASSFANALEHDVTTLRATEQSHRLEAQRCRQSADQARKEASVAGERAAQDEKQVEHLQSQLLQAHQEEQLLRTGGVLAAADGTVAAGITRNALEVEANAVGLAEREQYLLNCEQQLTAIANQRAQGELDRTAIEKEQERAQEGWDRALSRRAALEADATLLRLLQTDQVDVEAAATAAATQASDELRRATDAILRIGVEAAEDERAIHGLSEKELLPPSQDVQSLLDWLRQQSVICWSGWEYLTSNVTLAERRTVIRRVPQIASGVVIANVEYDRVVELLDSQKQSQPSFRSRSPLVVAPADALQDDQFGPWVVVGPTSDAHFDKGAGAQELTRLLADKSNRQQEITRFQEWRDALSDLKHRLHQFQSEFPRGWFSDHRQKLEIIESRLGEAQQLVQRLSNRQHTLVLEVQLVREQIRSLTTAGSRLLRNRDRLEQFERSFGRHRDGWQKELIASRERAEKARHQQSELQGKVSGWEQKEQQSQIQASTVVIQAAQLEAELAKVTHCDSTLRQASAGPTEDLRAQYRLLLADYEGKVRADALSQLAEAKDKDAEREDREFHRILSGLPQLSADEVIAELRQLPEGVSAQQQLEHADKALDVATGKLGPLSNNLKFAKAESEAAVLDCIELGKTGPLPSVPELNSIDEHQARAAAARVQRDEHTQLAVEFGTEVHEIAGRLTMLLHEGEKLDKDQQRLSSIGTNHERQFERLLAVTRNEPMVVALPAPVFNDSATLVARIDELESNLIQVREEQEQLDNRRETVAKDVGGWSRQERFGKLRSSISHRFLDRDIATLEAKAEFDIRQLNDCVFQIEEKLKEADKQRDIVIHVLATAVDEALNLLGKVSRVSKLPDSLPQAGKQFLKIETKASDNPMERRTYIGELIDELLERGDVGDGLQLVQKAVRRVARRISVRVLHPDLHEQSERVSIAQMRGFSGGERLTSAILLYCSLIRLRHSELNRRDKSSVLILDNPIGTASRLSFLDMQREVARAMNVQLIYATAVKDLNAVGALENIIRLRNTRVDRRTGRRFIETEVNGDAGLGTIDSARVVFDAAPSSLIKSTENGANAQRNPVDNEVRGDSRHA